MFSHGMEFKCVFFFDGQYIVSIELLDIIVKLECWQLIKFVELLDSTRQNGNADNYFSVTEMDYCAIFVDVWLNMSNCGFGVNKEINKHLKNESIVCTRLLAWKKDLDSAHFGLLKVSCSAHYMRLCILNF